jgi:hypothetical protein
MHHLLLFLSQVGWSTEACAWDSTTTRRCGARRRAACRPARCSRRRGPLPPRTGVGDGNDMMRPTSRSRGGATCLHLVDEARRELVINLKRSPARRKDAAHWRTGSAWRRTCPTHGEIMGDVQARAALGHNFKTANRHSSVHGNRSSSNHGVQARLGFGRRTHSML